MRHMILFLSTQFTTKVTTPTEVLKALFSNENLALAAETGDPTKI
jgi:hypothetical protein